MNASKYMVWWHGYKKRAAFAATSTGKANISITAVTLLLPPPLAAAPPQKGGIDQVSAMEEGPADQELPEEAVELDPIHHPVLKSP